VAFLDVLLDDCYGLSQLPDCIESILDIGAHAGLFSLAARNRFGRAQIHAYEPNPEMLPFLERQSKVGDFSVFNQAIGSRSGQVKIVGGEDPVNVRVVSDPTGTIKCTSLGEAVARLANAPILSKLDCEGAEWEILQDTDPWRKIDFLTMEYHLWAGYDLSQLQTQIESLGFEIKSISKNGPDFGIVIAQKP
jgi:FkbM family methyltransferase